MFGPRLMHGGARIERLAVGDERELLLRHHHHRVGRRRERRGVIEEGLLITARIMHMAQAEMLAQRLLPEILDQMPAGLRAPAIEIVVVDRGVVLRKPGLSGALPDFRGADRFAPVMRPGPLPRLGVSLERFFDHISRSSSIIDRTRWNPERGCQGSGSENGFSPAASRKCTQPRLMIESASDSPASQVARRA